jgi:nucleoside-diphosphate-sugar epimerase
LQGQVPVSDPHLKLHFPTRAIITGGNGYVGSILIELLLANGVEVHAIVNQNAERLQALLPTEMIHYVASDFVAVDALVTRIQPEAIYHLAAVHAEPPTFDQMMAMLHCSLLLGVALLHGASACRQAPVFVHAGTYWQFDEDAYAPNTFYAAAKQSLHDLHVYYERAHGVRGVTLILFDIYGPRDTRPKLWSKLREAERGTTFPLSEGRQLMELVHVQDIAQAFLQASSLLLQRFPLEAFHAVRSGVRITLRELLEAATHRGAIDLQFEWGAVAYWPGQIFEPWQGPILPGWLPSIHPVDGIIDVLRGKTSSVAADTNSASPETFR